MVINLIVGVYIPIIRIPIKGWMTIPNTRSLDPGLNGVCFETLFFFKLPYFQEHWKLDSTNTLIPENKFQQYHTSTILNITFSCWNVGFWESYFHISILEPFRSAYFPQWDPSSFLLAAVTSVAVPVACPKHQVTGMQSLLLNFLCILFRIDLFCLESEKSGKHKSSDIKKHNDKPLGWYPSCLTPQGVL